ncbi:outer membrane lipoprotein carrier protein LolA [Paenibacillus sp. B01]|uniref:LolA family protein n=1 Tax=Paenibacillus sp. B01 TaxID=2660554 RepID=UPI002B271E91|nr:outer membrane lipoprotein carrier protein LolA [Paenibacillus sp. B01]
MRRISLIAALMACFILVLAGCGKKDAGSVVKELGKLQEKTETYQGTGTMTLHTATQPLQYKVDVKFQKPNYYRIALTNEKKDLTQIVLRNDEGVFVLTPSLNKVFRFQSNWPEEQGQVYLYQTLVESILKDNSRQFASDKDSYVFDVMANYQNASLARQKIWLSKDDYAPKQVEVSDSNSAVLVDVKFDSFKFNEKLEKSVFDTKANLQSSRQPARSRRPRCRKASRAHPRARRRRERQEQARMEPARTAMPPKAESPPIRRARASSRWSRPTSVRRASRSRTAAISSSAAIRASCFVMTARTATR